MLRRLRCNTIARGDQTLIYSLSGFPPNQAYARVRENPARENRLVEVQVNSVTVAEYVYDGDGNQVKAIVTGGDLTIDTIFIGTYYQQTTTLDESVSPTVETTEWEKYYYAGSVRLAMREDTDDPLYLIGDHLGSTSLVLDSAGLEVAKQSYLPFGEDWGVSATDLPTDYTFTGQREAAEIGLHYYIARWYDSEVGHFIQAESIVPSARNAIAYNRFAYVKYNPLIYTDPNGHWETKNQFVEIMLEESHITDDPLDYLIFFTSAVFTGGPGSVVNYGDLALESDGNSGQALRDPRESISGANPADVVDLVNGILVGVRDNTNIIRWLTGYWHISGFAYVSETTNDSGQIGHEINIFIVNHTSSQVEINYLSVFRGNIRSYSSTVNDRNFLNHFDYEKFNRDNPNTCPAPYYNSYVLPKGTWSYSIPIYASGNYTIRMEFISGDQNARTGANLRIPSK